MNTNTKSYIQSNINQQEKEKIRLLLAKKLEKNQNATEDMKHNNTKTYPVSLMQRHMLENEIMNEESASYNLVSCVDIYGQLDVRVLENSFKYLIQSNGSLRTKFIKNNDEYLQVIEDDCDFRIEFKDFSNTSEKELLMEAIIEKEAIKKFQMNQGPLLKVIVIQVNDEQFTMVLTIHHAIADGWSLGVLIHQLQYYYNLLYQGKEVTSLTEKVNYIDYCIWKKTRKQDSTAYWINELKKSQILRLEYDFERNIKASYKGRRLCFTFDKQLTDELRHFSKQYNVTMSNIILTGFQILLSKYTGQKDFVIGMAIANRDHISINNLVGCCINTLAMRTILDEEMLVNDYLLKVQQKSFEIMNHKNVDLYDILDQIEYEKDSRFSPLFQVMYNYENTPKPDMNFESMEVQYKVVEACNALFDLTLSVFDEGKELTGFIEYKSEIFKKHRIEQLFHHLNQVLSALMKGVNSKIAAISLVSQEEKKELMALNVKTKVSHNLFLDRFREVVAKWGDKEAVYYEGKALTYKQLNEQSDKVAFLLIKQAEPKSFIGVYMDRSLDAIITILAILKAGMTYIPLDPSYPTDRIKYIISDAKIGTVITQLVHQNDKSMQSSNIKQLHLIEDLVVTTKDCKLNSMERITNSEDIAYIIYTSGTTGNPKGVMVAHRGLCNVIEEQERLFGAKEGSKILQFASLCFDASVFEIVMALGNGASLYIADRDKLLGSRLSNYIREFGITHICVTPSVLALADSKDLVDLQCIIVAGEACSQELAEAWSKNYQLFNAYGPTEATIWTTTYLCIPNKKVTIGKPLNNVETYVLDNNFNLVPKGHIGELYIGGIGLCKGYLHREDLNCKKFIKKQFDNGYETYLYASGDLVRLNEDNDFEFIGRKDSQIKVRGFRIEVDEIRSKILTHPDIEDVVVGVLKRNGMDILYAAVKSSVQTIKSVDLKHYLLKHLPKYMVPSVISIVEDIPLTVNAKIDYPSLEKYLLQYMEVDRKIREPETNMQQILCDIWKEVLGMEAIGVDEDFFELGGHSLVATKLANYISERFQIEFTTNMVFSYPNILSMEANIEKLDTIDMASIDKIPRQNKMELSSQQKQIWFMNQMNLDNGSYNIVTPIQLNGCLNIEILEKSFCKVIENHEILKVSFGEESGIPYQVVEQNREFRLNHYHLINFSYKSTLNQVDQLIRIMSKRGFDLSKDLLVRGVLVHLSATEYVLIIIMHHIISDGWSMELFIHELCRIYNQCLHADEITIDLMQKNEVQYFDYVYWKNQQDTALTKQKNYWKQVLDAQMNVLSVPADNNRQKIQAHNGHTIDWKMQEDITLRVKAFCSEKKITIFMFMMTAFSILLHKLTGSNDIPIGVPVAGRQRKDWENTIGCFVNTLVMRCNVNSENTIHELMEDIKKVSLNAYENQDVPFDDIVQMICPNRNFSHSPLVQVMLNVQNPDGIQVDLNGIQAKPYPIMQESSKFDMTLYVEEYFEKIKFRLVYDKDLYKQSRILEYLNQLNLIIESMLQEPDKKINQISIQSQSLKILLEQNKSKYYIDNDLSNYCLDEIVARTAAKFPDSVAVNDEKEALTYGQLEEAATKLANVLAENDIGKSDIVIIYANRSIKLVVSILAVLKVGAAFCIFDPEYPEKRLRRQMEVINAKGSIIINNKMQQGLKLMFETMNFSKTYEELMEAANNKTFLDLDVAKNLKDVAYVLFTSGTTGIPNCISTTHEPVSHFLSWFVEHYHLKQDCVFGLFAGLSHDPLLREIFTPLCVGARLAIHNLESHYDMDGYVKWMVEQKVTEVNITPSLFMMITQGSHAVLSDVRHYFFGGESLHATHIDRVRKFSSNAKCINFYGATETPQVMGYYDIPDDFDIGKDLIYIQGGIDEVQLYIVNSSGLEAGLGELGEIYIKTPHLSQGYWNNEKLNQEKFIDSIKDGWRIYKTGDIGRYQIDGKIAIEGRKDSQINIRGYRIETTEIEHALLSHDNVRNAIVISVEIRSKKVLVAYLVVENRNIFDTNQMRKFLMSYLPINVLPERFALLEHIPLTPNGKIDYKKLPRDFEEKIEAVTLPRDEIETKVKMIWSNVLETDNFGIDDNFFDIGGHSLLMVQVKTQIEEAFDIELKIMDLFHYHSIASISDYVKSKNKNTVKENIELTNNDHNRARLQRQSFGKFKQLRK